MKPKKQLLGATLEKNNELFDGQLGHSTHKKFYIKLLPSAKPVSGKMGVFPTLTRSRVTNHQSGERHPHWDAAFILLLYDCEQKMGALPGWIILRRTATLGGSNIV